MLVGWALGGIGFGIFADYLGQTKALIITILVYAVFTGLSALAQTWWELAALRLLLASAWRRMGRRGRSGCSVWPIDYVQEQGDPASSWSERFFPGGTRQSCSWCSLMAVVFVVGAAPAVLVLLVRMTVKEPESWTIVRDRRRQAKHSDQSGGELNAFTLKQLFSPALRRDTIVASSLAFIALLGVWGGTMWIPAAIREISAVGAPGLGTEEMKRFLAERASYALMLVNAGAIVGNVLFGPVADWKGRRLPFYLLHW